MPKRNYYGAYGQTLNMQQLPRMSSPTAQPWPPMEEAASKSVGVHGSLKRS